MKKIYDDGLRLDLNRGPGISICTMNFLKGLFTSLVLTALWLAAGSVTSYRLAEIERSGLIPYGPLPDHELNHYSYQGMTNAFDGSLPLKRSAELSKAEFESLILDSFEKSVQKNLRPHISAILNFSVDYQVDPFWIISIMMVESNFNTKAISNRNAMGLMQIKPDTALFLYQLMQKPVSPDQAAKNMYHPEENIEVGVFYLKKLLHNFRLNHRHATVAYNIGPGKLRSRLVEKNLDVDNFGYLLKVKNRYALISENFSNAIKKRPLPYELTYVIPNQGLKVEEKLINLLSLDTSENLMASFP